MTRQPARHRASPPRCARATSWRRSATSSPTGSSTPASAKSHAVAFAAGQAKAGMRPIVDIYSTFLQRGYDQIFQEVALQNLPVTFMLDRGGLAGPDGPTHHGVFDIGYLRVLPEHGRDGARRRARPAADARLRAAARRPVRDPLSEGDAPTRSTGDAHADRARQERSARWGDDGMIVGCGALLPDCLEAAELLRDEGLDVGVINARFVKPLDPRRSSAPIRECRFVVTVEEAALMGGFGRAVLEAAADAGRRHQPRPPPRHSRPLHRTRRARRAAGRPGPRRRRHRRRLPRAGGTPSRRPVAARRARFMRTGCPPIGSMHVTWPPSVHRA